MNEIIFIIGNHPKETWITYKLPNGTIIKSVDKALFEKALANIPKR